MSEETTTETTKQERWTPAEVEQQESRADEMEAKVEGLRKQEADLTSRIAEAHASGEGDLEALTADRREVVELRQDLEAALPVLRSQIAERREIALRGAAADRLTGIGRAHGSVRASYAEDVERIEAKARELAEAVDRFNERYGNAQQLEVEALCILDRWPDLDPPKITRVLAPVTHEPAVEALKRGSRLALRRPERMPPRLVDVNGRTARRLRQRIAGTPTAEILDAAGASWSIVDHDERHRKAMEKNRERVDAKRRDAIEAVDEWLRETLSKGPVPRDRVIEEAREKGIPVSGHGQATISEARRRLDVRTLNPVVEVSAGSHIGSRRIRRVDSGTDFWALPKGWDDEAFEEFTFSRTSSSAVRR